MNERKQKEFKEAVIQARQERGREERKRNHEGR